MTLDKKLIEDSTIENIKKEFMLYKITKTDTLTGQQIIKMPMGVDGVECEHFENDLENRVYGINNRITRGKYKFKPFREEIKSKDPKLSKEAAYQQDKYRILSIACIDDVITQKLIYKILSDYTEQYLFYETDDLSFAYRPNKSAPQAASKLYSYMQNGYLFALDADIKSFFDKIPHIELMNTLEEILGQNNSLVLKYLKRFIKTPRVEYNTYKGNSAIFQSKKPLETKRYAGVPRGGVLSGLLANIYLHQFDLWIKNELGLKYNLKYVRYADDFVILCTEERLLTLIKDDVREFLNNIKLLLHPDDKKTKLINLKDKSKSINFVGFAISPTGIRVKVANLNRFKDRIKKLIYEEKIFHKELSLGIVRLNYKIIGNEAAKRFCENCGCDEQRRSWMDYFLTVTDVQQLKSLDLFIRKQIYKNVKFLGKYSVKKNILIQSGILSLEKTYFRLHKENKDVATYCKCPLEKRAIRKRDTFGYLRYLAYLQS